MRFTVCFRKFTLDKLSYFDIYINPLRAYWWNLNFSLLFLFLFSPSISFLFLDSIRKVTFRKKRNPISMCGPIKWWIFFLPFDEVFLSLQFFNCFLTKSRKFVCQFWATRKRNLYSQLLTVLLVTLVKSFWCMFFLVLLVLGKCLQARVWGQIYFIYYYYFFSTKIITFSRKPLLMIFFIIKRNMLADNLNFFSGLYRGDFHGTLL